MTFTFEDLKLEHRLYNINIHIHIYMHLHTYSHMQRNVIHSKVNKTSKDFITNIVNEKRECLSVNLKKYINLQIFKRMGNFDIQALSFLTTLSFAYTNYVIIISLAYAYLGSLLIICPKFPNSLTFSSPTNLSVVQCHP